MRQIATDRKTAVVGIGATGMSVSRYLSSIGRPFVAFDTRKSAANLDQFNAEFPAEKLVLGAISAEMLAGFNEIVVSPGLSIQEQPFTQLDPDKVSLIGDIELFARAVEAPVVAITGSNGKSTVTTLVGEIFANAGFKVGIGGNIGTPALDLLNQDFDLYVLELSSFQLETTSSLTLECATILNLSQDHLDRYPDMVSYHAAKQRIYRNARSVVFNRADPLTRPLLGEGVPFSSFAGSDPDIGHYGLRTVAGERWLCRGLDRIMKADELGMSGHHNELNALAAIAIARQMDVSLEVIIDTLRQFKGLNHRCQTVFEQDGVRWVDDSKATNVGAARAAITSLAEGENIILIAGGQGKDQDFSSLKSPLNDHVKMAILIGEDARLIEQAASGSTQFVYATGMEAAVQTAHRAAQPGDIVLLSPACASFDQFSGFVERGERFATCARMPL